jgi:hypothetical protein
MAVRSLHALRPLRPTRIDVYDSFAEEKTAAPVKVAEVTVTGGKGNLVVLDPALAPTLRDVFERPTTLLRGGQRGTGAGEQELGADSLVVFEPWSNDALDHALRYGLPAHRLRGVAVNQGT